MRLNCDRGSNKQNKNSTVGINKKKSDRKKVIFLSLFKVFIF